MNHKAAWYNETYNYQWKIGNFHQRFGASRISPETLDALLADGWRHFGERFFRDVCRVHNNAVVSVLPLRINIRKFEPSKSQRRIIKKNCDVTVEFANAAVDAESERIFEAHSKRLRGGAPRSLSSLFSEIPSMLPCSAMQCRVTVGNELAAVSFIDIGAVAASSVYAVFDPEYSRRGLGILTLLKEIEYAKEHGKKYLYLGYAYRQTSLYDYKKQFAGVQYYNWQGKWINYRPINKDV